MTTFDPEDPFTWRADLTTTGNDVHHLNQLPSQFLDGRLRWALDDQGWVDYDGQVEVSADVARCLLRRNEVVRAALASVRDIPDDVRAELLADPDPVVAADVAARHDLTDTEVQQVWDRYAPNQPYELARAMVRRTNLPTPVGENLARSGRSDIAKWAYRRGFGDDHAGAAHRDPNVRLSVARRTTVASLLEEAFAGTDETCREAAAANPAAPAALLTEAATDGRAALRRAAAGNPSCPPEVLRALAADGDGKVRAAACANPSHPDTTRDPDQHLVTMLADRSAAVRAAAVETGRLTAAQLAQAADDRAIEVRVAVANSPQPLPDEVVERLAFDDSPQVPEALTTRTDLPPTARAWFALTRD